MPNSVRFKVKKEYNYQRKRVNTNILYGRTYQDYLAYMEINPQAKVVQLDSIIGKSNDKYALLTIFFLNSKFQLAIKYSRKRSNVNAILLNLLEIARKAGFKLFDVILCDNGSEFLKLPEIEKDDDDIFRTRVFYCDPYRSCQRAECERNHGMIRRIYSKGKSFDSVSQEDINQVLSHINSYPRGSLNNETPYSLFTSEYMPIIATLIGINKINLSDLRLIRR